MIVLLERAIPIGESPSKEGKHISRLNSSKDEIHIFPERFLLLVTYIKR